LRIASGGCGIGAQKALRRLALLAAAAGWSASAAAQPAGAAPPSDPAAEEQRVDEGIALYREMERLIEAGRPAEADAPARKALELLEPIAGSDAPITLTIVNMLAGLYSQQGRMAEAEPLYLRVLEARERVLGREHPDTLLSVNNLASLFKAQGRFADAEPLYLRALEARERVLGREDPGTLRSVNNLAALYEEQGRYLDAEPLHLRTLEARERLLGPDHPDTLTSVNNLAVLYRVTNRVAQAEPLYFRALAARERVLGSDHPDTLTSLNNLAGIYLARGRLAEAESLYLRAIERQERVLGREHPGTLTTLSNLAVLYQMQKRFADAEPLHLRALRTRERLLGPAHPDTLISAANGVFATLTVGTKAQAAIEPARLLFAGQRARSRGGPAGRAAEAQRQREERSHSSGFGLFADAAWSAAAPKGAQSERLRAEAFEALQLALAGDADRAVMQAAVRRYATQTGGGLSELVRERDALEAEWTGIQDKVSLTFAASNAADAELRSGLRARLTQVESRLDAIEARLRADFPDYFALIRPSPLEFAAVQRLLGPDEALLLAVPSAFGTHVVALTSDRVHWARSDWNADRVITVVQRLRWDLGAVVTVSEARRRDWEAEARPAEAPSFARGQAFALHQELVAPVAPLLAGKRRLFIAAGGALAGLPFSVLVAAPPRGADNDPASLRSTQWLGDRHALIHIPSIQSLALLRQAVSPARVESGSDFVGFGDPTLSGPTVSRAQRGGQSAPRASQIFQHAGARGGGGAMADPSQLRAMARLPGTARELEAVRAALGAGPASVHLGERATEPAVRTADLSSVRLLIFSTHGLTAEEATGTGEPGLVMTPPSGDASEADDGYLAASEVSALRLNADWVILSACNTATGEENAGLGGLARAFLYAGARNLLASHWPVSDDVAPVLITRTLSLEQAGMPRAEALQKAIREIRMDASHDSGAGSWAHPFYWAPFVLIGDGGGG
jgi:CHAT domain-containing protein/tetratricopeptide (TPR) repeat protein